MKTPQKNQYKIAPQINYKTNYLSWIFGGVGVLGLIGIVVYLAIRKGE
jgi:hypothetical protein